MTEPFAHAQRATDRRLRRDILRLIESGKPAGGLRGRFICDVIAQTTHEPPADDAALLGLLRDLVGGGYVTETDLRKYKADRLSLDTLLYTITHKGTALLAEAIDPDPLIEDPRK